MSLLIGTYNPINSLVDQNILEPLYDSIKHLPHEKYTTLIKENVALGHLLTFNTPEALFENQPSYDQESNLLMVYTGRIDNRNELANKLLLKISPSLPDGKLVITAFQKWGIECVHHLRGDWTFAVVDFKCQTLYLARSPMGYSSLYYTTFENQIYFGSTPNLLLAIPNRNVELNADYFLHQYILWNLDETHISTHFKGIFSVPMGSVVSIKNGSATLTKYWKPENIEERSLKNADDYTEIMLELFTKAVNVRLRSYKPVASMLSGGLDSSAVTYMASELQKKQSDSKFGKNLTTFSHVPLFCDKLIEDQCLDINKNNNLDETSYILEIAKSSSNIRPQLLNSANFSVIKGMNVALDALGSPVHAACNCYWLIDILQNAKNQGFGTLLTGEGGNGSISFEGLQHLLPITKQRFGQQPAKTMKMLIAKLCIPPNFYSSWQKFRNRDSSRIEYIDSLYLRPEVTSQMEIVQTFRKKRTNFNENYGSIKELKKFYIDLYEPRSQIGNLIGHYFGIEKRDPTADQDLMEFFFSIPNDVMFDDNFNGRMLVKRMMNNRIPASVLHSTKDGIQSADIAYRQKEQLNETFALLEKIEQHPMVLNYFDTAKIKYNLTNSSSSDKYMNSSGIYKTLLFGNFLKTYF